MATGRWAICPTCDRPVRLTDPELEAKRGFCARCGAQFEITQASLVGESPFRDHELVQLVSLPPRAPTPRIEDISNGEQTALSLRSASPATGWMAFAAVPVLAAVCVAAIAFLEPPLPHTLLLGLAFAAVVYLLVRDGVRQAFGADRLEIREDALWYRTGGLFPGRWDRTPLTAIRGLELDQEDVKGEGNPSLFVRVAARGPKRYRIRIERAGRTPIGVGAGLGHDHEAMSWVSHWLKEKIHLSLPPNETSSPNETPPGDEP